MSKRGYKLQEFVAHSGKVNCLNIGKKACRHFITGGDDHEVNLWAIGKPTSLMSLCGHTSPIESVSFDTSEVLVLAGASNGLIKLWDLEEAKMVRTLTGHRSNCTAVEFHPFGEFCASGSMDTNLKIWDIKKKGCIHTYKGHTQGISTIKFTPDGRWVVSGGLDNVVKVWDLTAGKLLHDFKFHEGPIRSLAFHPLEFLLASGSADKTVKFWDLESFELIGSTRPEATEVQAITFHPDGRSLFSGLDETLKVYSWEPVKCHDSVEMGWSTLGDLCVRDGKLLSCSYYRNSVGVWVADIGLIEPYGSGASSTPEKHDQMMLKSNLFSGSQSIASKGASVKASDPCSVLSDEIKVIKTIHVDTSGAKANTHPSKSLSSPSVVSQTASKEMIYPKSHNQGPAIREMTKLNEKVLDKSMVVPVVPQDNSEGGNDSANFVRESVTFSRTKRGMLLRPAQIRRPTNGKIDPERLPEPVNSGIFGQASSDVDITTNSNFKMRTHSKTTKEKESPLMNHLNVGSVEEKVDKILTTENSGISGQSFSDVNNMSASNFKTGTDSIASKEYSDGNLSNVRSVKEKVVKILSPEITGSSDRASRDLYSSSNSNFKTGTDSDSTKEKSVFEGAIDKILSQEKLEHKNGNDPVDNGEKMSSVKLVNGVAVIQGRTRKLVDRFERREQTNCNESLERREQTNCNESLERREQTNGNESRAINVTSCAFEMDKKTFMQEGEPPISGNEMPSANDVDAIEDLMQSHDIFLTGLRSRLTKLQVVRHFWERNDMKGAINAMTKLPDYSVQADVVSVLIEKMDILTLDLFSCLLPVLVRLLDSKIERHANLSLEMLLKLVAVFGPVIRSTVLARPVVGVDLHAEQRLKCCSECSVQLQIIQKILPSLVIKGGCLARSALELNLILQQS